MPMHTLHYLISYIINVDRTKNCHGVKYCNAGFVSAQPNGRLQKEFLIDGKTEVKKTRLELANYLTRYYTPAHAGADYHPAKIQWIYKNVLYTIQGFDTEDPQDFKDMANSAIIGK